MTNLHIVIVVKRVKSVKIYMRQGYLLYKTPFKKIHIDIFIKL